MKNYEMEQAEYDALVDTPEAKQLMAAEQPQWKILPVAPVAPAFETVWLPHPLREMAEAVAENIGVPVDLPSLIGLGVASACACGRGKIQVDVDWYERIQLYILCAMNSGQGKSPTYKRMTSLLFDKQQKENKVRKIAIEQAKAEMDVLQSKRAAAIKKPKKEEAKEAAREAAREIAEFSMPHLLRRFMSGNVTPEKMAEILMENDGSSSVMDDEGELFDLLAGRYNDNPDLGPYLHGYSAEPVQMERRSGTILVDKANISILALTQPYVLKSVMSNERMQGKGLFPRFLISCPEPLMEYVRRKPLPASVTDAYDKAVMRLWDTPICTLPLSPEAKGLLLDEFDYEQYERQKISGEWKALENDPFMSKLTGTTARLAGILHLWQEHPEEKIAAATMRNAIALARYFVGHRLHLLGGENSLTPPAADALKYLTGRKQAIQKERDVKRSLGSRVLFKTEGTLENALDELEAVGYIHRKKEDSGGRPSQLIELHPQLMSQGEEFTL